MKILVIGLDCATPELLLGEERLENVRCLMDGGCYGRLESIVPPITVPAWMCMATSQDPGSLGVYGFRNRVDHSYDGLGIVNSRSIDALALWDQVAREGKRSVIVGVPPCYPPRKVNGLSVGCFLTPDTTRNVFTHPAELGREISDLVGPYPVDVKNFRTHNKSWLKEEIYAMSRKHFAVVRHLLRTADWDYLQFVEIGLDRLQHGFWKYHDPEHVLHEPDSPYKTVIRDYFIATSMRRSAACWNCSATIRWCSSSPITVHGSWTEASASTSGSSARDSWCSTITRTRSHPSPNST